MKQSGGRSACRALTQRLSAACPLHFAGRMGEAVLELYPLEEGVLADSTVRLGFAVTDLSDALRLLEADGGDIDSKPALTAWGNRSSSATRMADRWSCTRDDRARGDLLTAANRPCHASDRRIL